jgi:hypothetical protein
MKWLRKLLCWIGIGLSYIPYGHAEVYEGRIIREVRVSCLSSDTLVTRVRDNISIQPGEVF